MIVTLERFNSVQRAELIKALLDANGIECSITHDTIQGVLPNISSGASPVGILVHQADVERAKDLLLAEFDAAEFEKLTLEND